jgi:hypothetical protein
MQMINLMHPGYKKNYINPYRHGVMIGNFVEDIIGEDLKQKYEKDDKSDKSQQFVSETKANFVWPKLGEDHIKVPGNDLTMKCNSNFDLNIDFNKKNVSDYLNLQHLTENEYQMNNKNLYLKNQIIAADLTNKFKDPNIQDNIRSQTQSKLKEDHLMDSRGILYTKKSGLVKNLFFGHGDQKNFEKNQYATTYLYNLYFIKICKFS